jgi:hypothetical protein
LGAIRFDRDVRSVANYLSTQTEFGGGREKFTRLQQIATILNLDPVSTACEPRVGSIHTLSIITCIGAVLNTGRRP